jgi:hypothetical protein
MPSVCLATIVSRYIGNTMKVTSEWERSCQYTHTAHVETVYMFDYYIRSALLRYVGMVYGVCRPVYLYVLAFTETIARREFRRFAHVRLKSFILDGNA